MDRNSYLRNGLHAINAFLRYRTTSLYPTSLHVLSTPIPIMVNVTRHTHSYVETGHDAVPDAWQDLLHYPLQTSEDTLLRVVTIATDHCAILPSKDRCPYLLVVEVIRQDGVTGSQAGMPAERSMVRGDGGAAPSKPPSDPPSPSWAVDDDISNSSLSATLGDAVLATTTNVDALGKGDTKGAKQGFLDRSTETTECDAYPLEVSAILRDNLMTVIQNKSIEGRGQGRSPMVAKASSRFRRRIHRGWPAQTQAHNGGISKQKDGKRHVPASSHHDEAYTAASSASFQRPPTWAERVEQIRSTSPFSHLPGWTVTACIVKSGAADIRREALAMQFINYFQSVFEKEEVDILLRPYRILASSSTSGLVEYLTDTSSIDYIKKSQVHQHGSPPPPQQLSAFRSRPAAQRNRPRTTCLREYFESTYGPAYSREYAEALNNFVRSLAGYSLVTYLLQVKDRHNGNILIDSTGKIVHIDFGFILGESPAFNLNFEAAPFKLTAEYVDLMGGFNSPSYARFQDLFIRGLFALRKHREAIMAIGEGLFGIEGQPHGAMSGVRKRCVLSISMCIYMILATIVIVATQHGWYEVCLLWDIIYLCIFLRTPTSLMTCF